MYIYFYFRKVRSGADPAATGDGIDNSNTSPTNNKMDMLGLLAQALYILISAAAVGMGSGLLISRLLKTLDTLKSSPVRQVAILMLGGYLSFRCVLISHVVIFFLYCLVYVTIFGYFYGVFDRVPCCNMLPGKQFFLFGLVFLVSLFLVSFVATAISTAVTATVCYPSF